VALCENVLRSTCLGAPLLIADLGLQRDLGNRYGKTDLTCICLRVSDIYLENYHFPKLFLQYFVLSRALLYLSHSHHAACHARETGGHQ
jgi:hypothetical protein